MNLVVCSECQRHVKAEAIARGDACPFCGAIASANARSAAMTPVHLSTARDRSVLLFGAAAVASALAVSACGRESDSGHGSGIVMPYGVPVPPYNPDAAPPLQDPPTTVDAGTVTKDAGAAAMMPVVPAYGAPPSAASGNKK